MKIIRDSIILAVALALIASCATTKYVEPGQHLLCRVSIRVDSVGKDTPRPEDLMSYVGQRPNKKVFGLFFLSLGIYNMSNPKSSSALSRRLRRLGEAPVIYSPQEAEYTVQSLTSVMYNKGYLQASTRLKLDTIGDRKVEATYHIDLGPLYRIAHHQEQITDSTLRMLLHPRDTLSAKRDFQGEIYRSYLTSGAPLAPDLMQAERRRIAQILRNRGYWGFREEQIRFDVDTLGAPHEAWIQTIIDSVYHPWRVSSVEIRHVLGEDSTDAMKRITIDSIGVRTSREHFLSPSVLNSRTWVRPGALYSQELTNRTYSALADLAPIRAIAVHYLPDSTRSTLSATIATQPEKAKEFSADLVGTHSGGNLGANISLAFMHNNIFGGAEQLKFESRGGYEDLGRRFKTDHYTYGGELSLRLPRLIVPFLTIPRQRPIRGTTDIRLSYDYQTRPEFRRDLFSTSWGYSWSGYRTPALRYQFKLLEIDYMHFGYMDEGFLSTVPLYARLLNYRDQFVVGASFMASYNSSADYRRSGSPWVHNLRLFAQSAGGLLHGLSATMGLARDTYGAYKLFNINFAQFIKGEIDYSGLYRILGKNALAYHAAVSAVYPYGNSRILPLDFRYFSGGASSVRGWSTRSLGPGSMSRDVGTSIFHQVGDIKLDLSLELRLRFSRSWELAIFTDAGNIWTMYDYENQQGGSFSFNRFYREIALSSGLGLRWDFDYFILRFDAGMKLYDPQQNAGARWVVGRQSLGQAIALHFALGYPF